MNKSDYNYIAAVEKAITKKYGKDTVQDFRSDWQQEKEKDYLDQLKKNNSWFDRNRGTLGLLSGLVVGVGVSIGIVHAVYPQ